MPAEERWQMTGSGPECYERSMVPALFAPWAHVLVERAGLQSGERILDAACGTGIVARLASTYVGGSGEVTGVDLNPGMLDVARAVSVRDEHSIVWQEGNLEALPFANSEFDVVLCQQGLQFSPKKDVVVSELHRVLRQRGRFVASVWRNIEHCPYMVAIASVLADRLGTEASQRMSAPCSLGSADELRALMQNAGFKDVELRIEVLPMRVSALEDLLPGQFAASPIAADIEALTEDDRLAFFDEIQRLLIPYMDDGGLAVPFEAHLVVAYR